eukprot:scaffold6607_cov73-Cylindrotheca_fusiformis.AAC.2
MSSRETATPVTSQHITTIFLLRAETCRTDPGGSDKDNGGPDGSQPASQTVSTTTEEKCCYRSCKVRGARLLPCRGPRKRKASPRGDAATTSNHKTKMKRNSGSTSPKNGVLLDDKAVNALVYSNKAAEDRMEEFACHNKAMERLEEKKQRLEEKKLK